MSGPFRIGATLALALLATVAIAQDISQIKGLWYQRQYGAILQPLLNIRDASPTFECDYMLGTALCELPDYASDGHDYLEAMLRSYQPPYYFDGRPVDIRGAERAYCPGAGVSGPAAPTTTPQDSGAGVTAYELRLPRTQAMIAKSIRSKLVAHPGFPPEFIGTYNMFNDGWPGILTITPASAEYIDQNKRRFNVRIARITGNHILFYVIGLGGQNTDGMGGQRFDGYLMTQTRNAIAGTTVWQGTTFGFYAIRR